MTAPGQQLGADPQVLYKDRHGIAQDRDHLSSQELSGNLSLASRRKHMGRYSIPSHKIEPLRGLPLGLHDHNLHVMQRHRLLRSQRLWPTGQMRTVQ